MSEDFKKLDQEQAMQRLKEIKREIRKHELAFFVFVAIAITTIMLIATGSIPFETLSIATLAICIASFLLSTSKIKFVYALEYNL